ncbi:hypothetical protein AG1IA_06187 [Rhizoctonia solani AG-1 IA]|uniref:Uncharacterized protein n=1 Tax=Thanatephorus cucumeris (strain AG1-IA) TaxID=983506 RepID=L8WTX7_THACA|nr:hypothetical protein AG1IA_06187 [Rhizoctonia solani AG-1 IA]
MDLDLSVGIGPHSQHLRSTITVSDPHHKGTRSHTSKVAISANMINIGNVYHHSRILTCTWFNPESLLIPPLSIRDNALCLSFRLVFLV